MKKEFEKFVISLAAIIIRNNKCLILEYAKYSKMWGLPGGRIDKGEFVAGESLRRELEEELGLSNFKNLGVVDYDISWNSEDHAKCNIILLIENDSDEIKISPEHIQLKWIGEDEINNYQFRWDNMERVIKNGFKYHKLLNNEK
ncbi:MAG: NUDIX domain-containing protein [Parcubacteria group bacterium]|jgi:8-oxo-dGTP pyrophosphatase MutT (NUDIX family)